jgi:hypothetical protein
MSELEKAPEKWSSPVVRIARRCVLAGLLLSSFSCRPADENQSKDQEKGMPTVPHPRLYFKSDQIDALRRKTEHPFFKADWEEIHKAAVAALEDPLIPEGRLVPALAQAADAASKCALVYRLTNEERFLKRARQICDAILAADPWTGNFLGKKDSVPQFHLETAMLCQRLAVAYDLLAPEFSASERKHFAQVCYDKALNVFLKECSGPDNPYLNGSRTINWLAVLSGGAGCLFIALNGDGIDFSREIEIARAHILRFIEWYDDDGSAIEHGGYWVYGLGNALAFLHALKENGWPKILWQNSKKLQRTAYPVLYACIGGKNVASFGDDSYGPLYARDLALLLAAEFQDARLQWWAKALPTADILGFIAGDPELKAVPPDDLPTCMVFQRTGIAVLRESMTDPDTRFLAIKAGRARGSIYDDPHCKFDLNSVAVDAFGESLLANPGYGHDWTSNQSVTDPKHRYNSTSPHNTILVDGKGQDVQFSPLAHLDNLSPSKEIDYVVSRIEQGYGPQVSRFDRHVYFINKRYYVVFDDIELTAPGIVTWNFHSAKEAKITAEKSCSIVNGKAELKIQPHSGADLVVSHLEDHVLPRLQWETKEKVSAARVVWLLLPQRAGEGGAPPTVDLHDDFMLITEEKGKQWRLPIVRCRAQKSSMTLIHGDQ